MTHTFVVNTENVNEYGYRILTGGIDTVQFMRNPVVLFGHVRALHNNPEAVVGRVVKLTIQDNNLMAEVEFDANEKFAQKVAKKVEGGYIRMASMYADVIEGSVDPSLLLPGQKYETITKCKLVEISIVDIGGNDDALKLSKNGQPIKLRKVESKLNSNKDMSNSIKTIALALALTDSASDVEVIKEIAAIKLAKETADAKVIELTNKIKDIEVVDAEILVNKAVALGLIPEALKASQLKAFESDFPGQKAVLSKIINDKEAETGTDTTHKAVTEVVLGAKGKLPVADDQESFDYLQKHDVAKLTKLRDDEPAKYAKLAKEYADGKRYIKN